MTVFLPPDWVKGESNQKPTRVQGRGPSTRTGLRRASGCLTRSMGRASRVSPQTSLQSSRLARPLGPLPRIRFTPEEISKAGQNHWGPSENPKMNSVPDRMSAQAPDCVSLSPRPWSKPFPRRGRNRAQGGVLTCLTSPPCGFPPGLLSKRPPSQKGRNMWGSSQFTDSVASLSLSLNVQLGPDRTVMLTGGGPQTW